ncbi:GIY-YIG nuclease family protein [Phyllobacterium chamaecytisi]|uniref:GIY-YIG nuclease family protein n=1 Tax=Phyllobacterium chamaecytisi TaxID=2876082 RepID=UPI001CCECD97|nr:GIY-YIG nuclease family protein [Phyllobacterium sp. KW56]MBZ9600714.1 GIY-YIG nuclease family protein [Phyllobacterium sp. KW56]
MSAEAEVKAFIDRILRLKEEGATRQEVKAAYAGLSGDQKNYVGLMVRQEWQRRQGWRVYFAAFPKSGLIKIGISKNVEKRLRDLSKIKGEEAELLFDFPGMFPLEGWYHAVFHDWRVVGEWFALNDLTLAKVDELRRNGPAIKMEAA